MRLDVSCESSAKQRIHMKYQALFYQKNNEKIYKTVICCSRDWRFKGYGDYLQHSYAIKDLQCVVIFKLGNL